jgi:hypothetical protein
VEGEIFKNRTAISKEKALQILGFLSTVRSVTNGVHEIFIICISILSMKLMVETGVQVHVRIIGPLFYNESFQYRTI